MNLCELKETLVNEKFNKSLYSVDSKMIREGHCLEKVGGTWEIYYIERGLKFENKIFNSESDACSEFLKRIRSDPFAKRKR